MPLQMAPMACSRTPKRMLRSAYESFWKSPNICRGEAEGGEGRAAEGAGEGCVCARGRQRCKHAAAALQGALGYPCAPRRPLGRPCEAHPRPRAASRWPPGSPRQRQRPRGGGAPPSSGSCWRAPGRRSRQSGPAGWAPARSAWSGCAGGWPGPCLRGGGVRGRGGWVGRRASGEGWRERLGGQQARRASRQLAASRQPAGTARPRRQPRPAASQW